MVLTAWTCYLCITRGPGSGWANWSEPSLGSRTQLWFSCGASYVKLGLSLSRKWEKRRQSLLVSWRCVEVDTTFPRSNVPAGQLPVFIRFSIGAFFLVIYKRNPMNPNLLDKIAAAFVRYENNYLLLPDACLLFLFRNDIVFNCVLLSSPAITRVW